MNRPWPLLLILGLLPLLLLGCREESPVYNRQFEAFGGPLDLSIVGVRRDLAETAARAVEADFKFMEQSWGRPDTPTLDRVNQGLPTGKPFAAPPCLLPLLLKSQELAAKSDNLFNPAIGKLIDLWGFASGGPARRSPPDKAKIQALVKAQPLLSQIKVDGILLEGQNPQLKLDFEGISRGYGIDLAIAHLRDLGIHNAQVNAGGDLRAIGTRDGQSWPVAIRNPVGGGVLAILQISGDESVFTAGDYEHNFTYKGKTYHHYLDPGTGWPAEGTRLVTVIHEDATSADAAASALMIAGPERWHATARALGVRSALLIDQQGRIFMDPAMARRVELLDRNAEVIQTPPLSPVGGGGLPGP